MRLEDRWNSLSIASMMIIREQMKIKRPRRELLSKRMKSQENGERNGTVFPDVSSEREQQQESFEIQKIGKSFEHERPATTRRSWSEGYC